MSGGTAHKHYAHLAQVEVLTRNLELTNEQLRKVMELLLNDFNRGLNKDTNKDAVVKMFITYVRDVPDGSEQGKYLALDLGGTNFRVLLVELDGEKFHMDHCVYPVPQDIMNGTGTQLFDHIANCLSSFASEKHIDNDALPLAFTFSFPCKQETVKKARLVSWTKGFKCSGTVGEDISQMLTDAIKRQSNANIEVSAVVNDTTGTLMSCAHLNRDCRVGVILGTGCNLCYMEKLENVGTWDGDNDPPRQVIINTECGAFGSDGCLDFIRTQYDKDVDKISINEGKQIFEKMVSGMYMGEIVRRIIVDMANKQLIFNGYLSEKMKTPWAFKAKYVSEVETDTRFHHDNTRQVMSKMEVIGSDEDCETMRLICTRVSGRTAYMVSAAIATVLNRMDRPNTVVGIDGSVYRYHPRVHSIMMHKIAELVKPNLAFDLMLSEDGSGRGAALIAAVAAKQKQ